MWPQSVEVDRPQETPLVPALLDWDLWIGPAPMRPYHPAYHPSSWRGWWDFGTGSLGDMGCHILDVPFWALKLKYPVSVEACISTHWKGFVGGRWQKTEPKNEQFPRSTIVRYQFPARGGMPEVQLTWWDGGLMPPRPAALEEGRRMGDEDGGVLFVGDRASLMCGCFGRGARVDPRSKNKDFRPPARTLPRIPAGRDGHELDWIALAGEVSPPARTSTMPAPFRKWCSMGNLAVRYPDRRLLWNGEKMEVTNDTEANTYVRRQYRQGWTL